MKSFVVVAVLVAVVLQAEGRPNNGVINGTIIELEGFINDELQQAFRCAKRLGAEKITRLPPTGGIKQLPENNPVLNEYFECLWKEKGIISKNAVFNEDKLKNHYKVLFPMVGVCTEKCKNVLGNDSGQRAVKIQNCITNCIREKI